MTKRAFIFVILIVMLMAGCSKQEDSITFKGQEGDWKINIPKSFQKVNEERIEEQNLLITNFKEENGRSLSIGEMLDTDMEVSEAALLEELEEDHYLHIQRTETIDIKEGKIYGALIEDEATTQNLLYYKFKKDDKIITFVIYQSRNFTLEEEAQIKAMLSTLKVL